MYFSVLSIFGLKFLIKEQEKPIMFLCGFLFENRSYNTHLLLKAYLFKAGFGYLKFIANFVSSANLVTQPVKIILQSLRFNPCCAIHKLYHVRSRSFNV